MTPFEMRGMKLWEEESFWAPSFDAFLDGIVLSAKAREEAIWGWSSTTHKIIVGRAADRRCLEVKDEEVEAW